MNDRIKEHVSRLLPRLQQWRRHLHAHPELSYAEHATAAYVAEALREAGIASRAVAGTGLVAELIGEAGPGDRTIALRADLDALPIHETSTCSYRSVNEGVMHACGHDAHTAMVLGAALVLHELRTEWRGRVLLVFQPGEEKIPGGATLVLKENGFGPSLPHGILGQHVTPELEVGKVGFHAGPFMASSDELYVTVKGRGGHAAQPEKLIDPIVIAAHLLLRLKEEFAALHPGQPKVLAFGKFLAEGATNVIPGEVTMAGTLRAFDETVRVDLHAWLPRRASEICAEHGGTCDFEVRVGYPVLVNDEALTARIRAAAVNYLGATNVVDMDRRMGSEDFAFYTHVMPGCFFRLGTGNPAKGITSGLHTPTFDIDEDALAIGCGVMVVGAMAELEFYSG